MQRAFFILFLLLMNGFSLACPLQSMGDNTTTRPLSIEQAVSIALRNNPMVTMAQAQLNVARHRIDQAASMFWPQVDLNGSAQRTTNPMWAFGTKLNQGAIDSTDFVPDQLNTPDPINNFGGDISLGWTLYKGGQMRIDRKQAHVAKNIARLNLDRTHQQVISQTAIAYAGLLLAQENLSVVDQTLKTAETNLKLVESVFKAGVSIKSDVLRARVRIADLTQMKTDAETKVETAWAHLNTVLGAMTHDRYHLTSSLAAERKMDDALSFWVNSALNHRPDLKEARLQKQIAVQNVQKARGAHLPYVNLTGKYEINTEDFDDTADNYTLAAGVRVNLFSGLRLTAAESEARALLAAAQAVEYQTILGVRFETESAFQQAKSALMSIGVSKVAVTQAEETLRIISNRYKNGLVTIVALLDAEVALQQAKMNHFSRLHDFKVAMVRLLLSAGIIENQVSFLL